MGLGALLKKLANDSGIELDDDELESLGLSIDDDEERAPDDLDVLGDVLSGEAAGLVEIYLAEPKSMLADGKAIESDGLMWEPILREGQWAVRPGARGQGVRRPLKVVAGRSQNQRKEIGLQDIVDAHNDEAVQHVTVPTSHDNLVTQNTGFIQKVKVVQGKIKDKASKAEKKVAILMGGYDIRKPEIKRDMELGTIANRSAGLLYDYVNTETGKKYPVVLEHVALTNKPWITGMKSFGRKLIKKPATALSLSLSDDEPAENDLLANEDALDGIELASTEITWDQEDDPDWLREQTNEVLRAARDTKALAKSVAAGVAKDSYLVYESMPRYRCVKARPGLALVADGWGDEANFWTVPIKVVDGIVEVDQNLENWKASKKVFVPDDDRKDFPEGKEPLSDDKKQPEKTLSALELAQQARSVRANPEGASAPNESTTHPRGGEHMAGDNGTLQLSEEAQRLIDAANKRAEEAEKGIKGLEAKFSQMFSTHVESKADSFVSHLKSIGLDEEHGFSGALVEIRNIMLADDGGPAVQGDKFSSDSNATGELTISAALERVFRAIELSDDGKVKFGSSVVPKTEEKKGEAETKLGEDGKPLKDGSETEKAFDQLSEDEQMEQLARDNPELAKRMGFAIPSANGSKGGE